MSKKIYISKKILAAERELSGFIKEGEDAAYISNLVFEDKKRQLTDIRDTLVKKRDKASLYFVVALAIIFVAVFFLGLQT